ncbi:hypothetical protein GJAV_G00243910 [Gymnothorax javanicus]|nr:hypothetical protein GJAV_G00243910 [Gymnothorax javanicus]
MAHSGVSLDPKVDEYVQKMLMPSKIPKGQQLKLLVLCIDPDAKCITVDEENTKRVDDLCSSSDIFCEIMSLFKSDDCRYALYDCAYESKECGCKTDLVFISWTPDSAVIRKKMVYAASVDTLKKKYHHIRHHWQLSDQTDKDKMDLVEKFGTKGSVTHLEGIPLCKS